MSKYFLGETSGNRFFVSFERNEETAKKTERYLEHLRKSDNWNFDSALLVYINKGFFELRVIEKDRSESDMCGNGVRLASEILSDYFKQDPPFCFKGNKGIAYGGINKGSSSFMVNNIRNDGEKTLYFLNERVRKSLKLPLISVCGEPHLVMVVGDVHRFDLEGWGGLAVLHRVNLTVISEHRPCGLLEVRTFERGLWKEIRSCGTGIISAVSHFIDRFYLFSKRKFNVVMGGHHFVVEKNKWMKLSGDKGFFYSLNPEFLSCWEER